MKKIIATLLISFAVFCFFHKTVEAQVILATPIEAGNDNGLQKLYIVSERNEESLKSWYLSQTEGMVDESQIGRWFGPWAIETDSDNIYLGLSDERPAASGRSTVTKIQTDTDPLSGKSILTTLPMYDENQQLVQSYLDENGIHNFTWVDDNKQRLLIPGTDPGNLDGWNGGNIYWYDKNIDENLVTKVRCGEGTQQGGCQNNSEIFPNIVHFFGATRIGDSYFMGGSIPVGNTAKPQIWGTTNAGTNWNALYTFPSTSTFRSKNLFSFKDPQDSSKHILYSVNQYNMTDSLITYIFQSNERTSQLGTSWQPVAIESFDSPHINLPIVTINDDTAYFSNVYGGYITKLNSVGTYETIPYDNFYVGYKYHQGPDGNYFKYHGLTTDDTYLYVVADNDVIYRYDLRQTVGEGHWEDIYRFTDPQNEKPYMIKYWPEKQGLIIGTIGPEASLYFMHIER